MKYGIVTHNQIIGVHCWQAAPDEFAYLRNLHRHVFTIRCKFEVSHTDRQIEINNMQEYIEGFIRDHFPVHGMGLGVDFGGMSCEDIALFCTENFGCVECEVLEDGFGGAYAWK